MKSNALKTLGTAVFVALALNWFDVPVWGRGNGLDAPLPAQESLGRVWHTTEAGGWTGTWTRRGGSMTFDTRWVNGSQNVTGVPSLLADVHVVQVGGDIEALLRQCAGHRLPLGRGLNDLPVVVLANPDGHREFLHVRAPVPRR
jgi:hypothetical protein